MVGRKLGRLLVAITAVVGMTFVAGPAQASGGGCSDKTQGGFAIGVCSSDDGVYMYRDFYINSASWSGTCYSRGRVVQSDGNNSGWTNGGCTVGRWVGPKWAILGVPNSVTIRHHVQVIVNGSVVFDHYGPITRCC